MITRKTNWGGQYSGLSKKQGFLRQFTPLCIPALSLLGLIGLTSALFVSADLASNSYAFNTVENSTVEASDGTHYVSLSAPDIAFTASPTNTAVTDQQIANVTVKTNVTSGVSLYLSATSNTNALYKDGDPTAVDKIEAAASTPTTLDNLAPNTWAYSTDHTNYQGVPTSSDTNSPNLIADINGTTTGTTSGGVTSATIPIYYAAKIDTSIPAGSYASSVTYSAVVDGGIVTSAELTSITVDGNQTTPPSAEFQAETENIILITTNLKTNTYGTPRVYYTATDPSGYQECDNIVVGSNNEGYMTVTCTVTPTTEATNVTLHIVPKGEPSTGTAANNNLTGDPFCTDGTYNQGTSECEAGQWKWGSFTVSLPDITPPPTLMSEISTMQEMTPEFCASVTDKAPGNTARLKDTRDGKYYWVAKLKDGNCWMTQNLDLDLDGRTLSPADSDVSSNWAPGNVMFTTVDGTGTTDYDAIQAWDLGEWVKTDPDAYNSSSSSTQGYAGFSQYFTDVSGMTPMTEAINEGKTPAENISVQDGQYDAHFLVGNHYSFQAATAGTAPKDTGGDAPDSICPAGWQLPRYTNASSSNADYRNLLVEYGLNSSNPDGALNTAPLYFVRSGYVFPNIHYLDLAGNYGTYWYGRAHNSSSGSYLSFGSTNVNPTNNYYRYNGYSVRCIAPSA